MENFKRIRWIWSYFKPYYPTLLIDLFCAALTAVSAIVLPMIIRNITNVATIDIHDLTWELILSSTLLFFILKGVEVLAQFYMTKIGHMMGAAIERDMRRDLYSHLQSMSVNFYNDAKVGQIMSRVTNDLFDITEFAHHCPEEYFIGALKILVSFFILFFIEPVLTICVYLILPLMFFAASHFKKKMGQAQREQRVHMGDLNATIEDSLSGIRVTKSFANEEMEIDRFNQDNEGFLDIKRDFYRFMAGYNSIVLVFEGLMYLVVILLGGYFLLNGRIFSGDMVAYTMYVTVMTTTVRRLMEFAQVFQQGMTGIERFQEIMAIEPDVKESEDPIILSPLEGRIDFDQVDFNYGTGEKILRNFNLHIAPGEHVALVGRSGVGKTTICNLIPRFFDVEGGAIYIDGVDNRKLSLYNLRNNIGAVQQDVYLFDTTVLENIRYGKPDATEEEVVEAAKLANAYDFIMGLEEGFYTRVGDKGARLSGGQKQRISIARVFLKNPPILLLDEATSALDNESEIMIQHSLDKLSEGRTTLTIAHRLSTVQNAHRILVMEEEGTIVEEGSHDDLMALGGHYYRLYTRSSGNQLFLDEESYS